MEKKLGQLNREFEERSPEYILQWAALEFEGKIAVTSSFQTQSVPLLHMISEIAPWIPVLFLDTGYHFPETLVFRDQLIKELSLNVQVLTRERDSGGDVALYRTNPDACCYMNKVEPLQNGLKGRKALISGIRRDQTLNRRNTPIIQQREDGVVKICPMVNWTSRDVWKYIHLHDLPLHPLFEKGYMSIGCLPCTKPVFRGEDERSGRWSGHSKVECGLHTTNLLRPAPRFKA